MSLYKYRSVLGFLKTYGCQNNIRLLATQAAVNEEKLPRFRTLEHNPVFHTENHIAKFYTIPDNIKKRLFLSGGIPKSLDTQMKAFTECSILIRKPAVDIINVLKNFNYSLPAYRFVLYGANGVGKTVTLMHLIHFAYVSKYVILHIPWVSCWTKRPKEIVDSLTRPGRIDLPIEAALWLQHFKTQNLELLKTLDLHVSQSYTWSQREVTEGGQPLTDVLEHGINRARHGPDCIAVLLKEIKHHSASGKFKTMVVIDGVNAFYFKTNIKRPDKTLVKATDVTMVHAFEKMIKNDWTNAVIITTVDSILANRDITKTIPFTPRALLGKEGFEIMDPFIPVHIENYTDKEIESVFDYYTDRLWIQLEDAHNERGRAELKFLSGHNPYKLMKLCDPL